MLRLIAINSLMIILLNGCIGQSKEKMFITKYEFENFSQFEGFDIAFRGTDKQGNLVVFGYAPILKNDTSKLIHYVSTLDKNDYQVIETKLSLSEDYVDLDTLLFQQLAQKFMKYEISRLSVDEKGNVFVYLEDFEKLTMVQFINESELLKYPHQKWINIKNNWYKPK